MYIQNPVMLLPGRLRLVTRPSLRGSLPVVNTMGIVDVADLVGRGIAQLHNEKQQRRWTPRAEELPICASCASADIQTRTACGTSLLSLHSRLYGREH